MFYRLKEFSHRVHIMIILENEYQKENSPIIQRRVHSFEASLTQK